MIQVQVIFMHQLQRSADGPKGLTLCAARPPGCMAACHQKAARAMPFCLVESLPVHFVG
jgi:hypothetical protein